MSTVKSWTQWERRYLDCRKCVTPSVPTSLLTATVPSGIRNDLIAAMQGKIMRDCSSGVGINVGPLPPLPPVPNGFINQRDLEFLEKANEVCEPLVSSRVQGCGMPCGGKSNPDKIRTNPATPGCRTNLFLISKIISQKKPCSSKQVQGMGPSRKQITVTYRVRYCISSKCSNGCVPDRFFSKTLTVPTKIVIYKDRQDNVEQQDHCCAKRGNRWDWVNC